jgi:hypothetical protein
MNRAGATGALIPVPARIRSRARQKGWGPFSNWYKSVGLVDQVLIEIWGSIIRYKTERSVLDKSKISKTERSVLDEPLEFETLVQNDPGRW